PSPNDDRSSRSIFAAGAPERHVSSRPLVEAFARGARTRSRLAVQHGTTPRPLCVQNGEFFRPGLSVSFSVPSVPPWCAFSSPRPLRCVPVLPASPAVNPSAFLSVSPCLRGEFG